MGEPGSSEIPVNIGTTPNNIEKKPKMEVKTSTDHLRTAAEKIVDKPIPLITNKEVAAPSGDNRDFVSLSRYWYKTESGELEVRDGEVNPETENYPDSKKLDKVASNILITSIAAKSAENQEEKERFAHYAVSTLRA